MMSNLALTIGAALRRERRLAGLTAAAVAESVQLSVEFYSRLERGSSRPSIRTLARLAMFFDVSIDELLGLAPASSSRLTAAVDGDATRRVVHQIRTASPATLRIVSQLLEEIETFFAERPGPGDSDSE